jgi:hypothetical protein
MYRGTKSEFVDDENYSYHYFNYVNKSTKPYCTFPLITAAAAAAAYPA